MLTRKTIIFILQSIMAGMSLALIVLLFNPEWLNSNTDNTATHTYRAAVARSAPAVVNVYASSYFQQQTHPLFQDPIFKRFFGKVPATPNQRRNNLGSGVIIRPEGYILTSAHLVRDADSISITLADGRNGTATLMGSDPGTDVAVLKTDMDALPSITIGDPTRMQTGDVVLAIGNPFDFGQTVTQGIISAMGRTRLGITSAENFIQTDAAINPGNSGGALVNVDGAMIGLNSAMISNTGGSQGIGLAVPVNIAIDVMDQIIARGSVERGWLGIEAQILSPIILEQADLGQTGVLIAGIYENGPAHNAGMMPGDIIVSIDDKPVTDPGQVIRMISDYQPGTRINVKIMRGWEEKTIEVTVNRRPNLLH